MGDLKYLLPILVAVILVWITYLVINFVATIIKTKKKDDTMVCGLNMQGKIFYAIIIVIYLVMLVYCIYYMITHLLSGDVDSVYLPLNALTAASSKPRCSSSMAAERMAAVGLEIGRASCRERV